jgi:homoserine O-acetyltransferase/O-succinyltransferase
MHRVRSHNSQSTFSSHPDVVEQTVAIGALTLDDGSTLPSVKQRVTMYGDARSDGSNIVLVAHALTGSSRAADWWPGIVGESAFFNPGQWCVIGINVLGGCYGSTGPSNRSPFPRITVRDIVRAQRRALDELGIFRIGFVIGGSLGGMQALQWALDAPQRVGHAIVVGAHDHQSPMAISLNAIQRECIQLDPERGLGLARKLAMLTYKSEELLSARHDRRKDRNDPSLFDVEGYLEYQARIFRNRMDPATYVTLTHAMDSFDVRDRLTPPGPELTFISISSDWLFRPQDVRAAAERLGAHLLELHSDHGHDAFLAETEHLAALLARVTAGGTTDSRL